MRELQFVDRSAVLGGQAFSAILPLLMVLAILTNSSSNSAALAKKAGVAGSALGALSSFTANSEATRGTVGVITLVFMLVSATSFTRKLQRMYELTWDLAPLGMRALWRGVLWLLGLALYAEAAFRFARLVSGLPARGAVSTLGSFLMSILLWWSAQFAMCGGRIRPRALLPGALLTSVCLASYTFASRIWLPFLVARYQRHFGVIGLAFALYGWLTAAAFVLVVTTIVGAVIATRPPHRLVARLVGPGPVRRTSGFRGRILEPPTPLPARPVGLADASNQPLGDEPAAARADRD